MSLLRDQALERARQWVNEECPKGLASNPVAVYEAGYMQGAADTEPYIPAIVPEKPDRFDRGRFRKRLREVIDVYLNVENFAEGVIPGGLHDVIWDNLEDFLPETTKCHNR